MVINRLLVNTKSRKVLHRGSDELPARPPPKKGKRKRDDGDVALG